MTILPRHLPALFAVESIIIVVLFGAVVYYSRATQRRVAGALVGGLAPVAMVQTWLDPLVARTDLFSFEDGASRPPLATYPQTAVALAMVALVAWRVQRRYGASGALGVAALAALVLPVRDYLFDGVTNWIEFGPGPWPWVLDSLGNALAVLMPVSIMRLIAGPARSDALRFTTESSTDAGKQV